MNKQEFENIVIDNLDGLKRYCYNVYTKNITDVDDIVQDTYLKVLNYYNSGQVQSDKNIQGLLYTIMKTVFISYKRKKKESLVGLRVRGGSYCYHVRDYLLYEILSQKCYNLLNKDQRLALIFSMDFTYKEASEKLNITVPAYKKRLFTARQILKSHINIKH